MREIQYKAFSLRTHKKNWQINRPNVCQFELTFGCGLRCRHCYTDCYDSPSYLRQELKTKEVKYILDKVYNAGCIWLCFTGGDPLTRNDFLEIYAYAKNKGFIVTIFTNAYSITEEIIVYLKKSPPFVIEMTLNAVTEDLYEKISQVKGSFLKVMQAIDLILKARLSLKIKTQVTQDNFSQFSQIKKFIQGLGLQFRPSIDLHARLNGDLAPCNLRLQPKEILSLNGNKRISDDDCRLPQKTEDKENAALFRCAVGGGDGMHIDPYGYTFLCNAIRRPSFNLLKVDIEYVRNKLLSGVRNRKFTSNSKCNGCDYRQACRWCPGRGYLETGDMEQPIEYYCQITRLIYGALPLTPLNRKSTAKTQKKRYEFRKD